VRGAASFMPDLPLLVVAAAIWIYWLRVGAMVIRLRRRGRHDVGLIPERAAERVMWLAVVPTIVAWIVLPAMALTHARGLLAVPAFAREGFAYPGLRWIAALVALACLVATLRAWRSMGRHWRMDISDRNTALVTGGLFAYIRHPIYAFSIAMMLATAVVLPTVPMLVVAAVHVVLMNVKARNEEAHLARIHGDAYARYVQRTGRFFPRPAPRHP
jgi:protein-S-isoprenylcysteine O-methyltransferase Ste14